VLILFMCVGCSMNGIILFLFSQRRILVRTTPFSYFSLYCNISPLNGFIANSQPILASFCKQNGMATPVPLFALNAWYNVSFISYLSHYLLVLITMISPFGRSMTSQSQSRKDRDRRRDRQKTPLVYSQWIVRMR
jgi:hypothetical protein